MTRIVAVIGGGIVGLATGYELLRRYPDCRLLLLEKEAGPGRHQTGHNSGVLHCGLYYKPGSIKARLAVQGIRRMTQFCAEQNVPFEQCGKVVVATDEEELPRLRSLLERGKANGLEGLRWLGPEELSDVGWLPADRPFVAQLRAVLLDGTRLLGGNVGGAVRVGGTVRRARGPWTPSVHALLRELRGAAGVVEVPRVYGFDARGREVLEYLPGRVPEPDVETSSDELLGDAMRWLRRLHDAVAGTSLPGPWRTTSSAPGAGELLCHNDFAPYNVAVSTSATGERLVGVFDWDLAGPATRLEELAFAAWNWVPMWQVLPAATAAYRLETMAAAYGDVSAEQILDGVVPRIEKTVDLIRAGLASGDAGMANLASVGEPQRTVAALDALRGRVPDVRAALLRRGAT